LFITILGLKWRVEVDNDSLTLHHPFKRPNIRRFMFDEITSAKYGARGLSIYTGDKRAFSIDGFSVGCRRLAIQLEGMSKLKGGLAPQLWASPEINPCRQCGTKLSDSNEFCWKCGSPQPVAGGAPLPTPQNDQPAPQYRQSPPEQQADQEPQSPYHQTYYGNEQASEYSVQNAYAQPDPQVVSNLKNAVGEMDKAIHGANGVVIFIAIVNLLFGVAFTFFPDVISEDGMFSDFVGGIYYIIPALLFTGLSFGVFRRSRACILIATIYMVIDAVLLLFVGGFGDAVAFMIMRIFLIISLFAGVRFCFRYHSVVKQHANNAGVDRQVLLNACKPKIQKWQIITCAVLAVVGIGTAAYGFTGDAYVEGRNFEDWVEHSIGPVTVRMPSSVIWENNEDIPDLPGARFMSAYSETQAGNAVLISYQGILNPFGIFTLDEARDLEYEILGDLVYDIGASVIDNYEDVFQNGVIYVEVIVELEHEFGVLRSFTIGYDIFITGIFVDINKDRDFIDLFLDSIRID